MVWLGASGKAKKSLRDLGRLGLQGHQAGGSVCQHVKVRSGRGAHGCGPALGVHLVVNQTPLLQEGVDSAAEESQSNAVTCWQQDWTGVTEGSSPTPEPLTTHLMIAHTSPARFLRQAVEVRYSWGFSR